MWILMRCCWKRNVDRPSEVSCFHSSIKYITNSPQWETIWKLLISEVWSVMNRRKEFSFILFCQCQTTSLNNCNWWICDEQNKCGLLIYHSIYLPTTLHNQLLRINNYVLSLFRYHFILTKINVTCFHF